ncbi:MAG: hypothetical protein ACLQDY_05525 [Streptosporangiaceae bacterium]
MPRWTLEEEASYALNYGVSRDQLSRGAQVVYDQLVTQRRDSASDQAVDPGEAVAPAAQARSSPEARARILEMFKRGNRKYALPFERDRLAVASVMGGNWEEYGQIVLQMAILDTLLSIEELLAADGRDGQGAG